MFSEELVQQEFYRLKNDITDLKNALDINRDILTIITSKKSTGDAKTDTLFRIINRLTKQSNQALLSNAEILLQKSELALQITRVKHQLYNTQRKLQAELQRNSLLQNPTVSKMTMQQQFSSMNTELLASHEEKIHLQEEINRWKERYLMLEKLAQKNTMQTKELQIQDTLIQIPLKKSKISRKYTCNKDIQQHKKSDKLEKQISSLKRYIEQLQNRIIFFIKAYNMQQDMLQKKNTTLVSAQTLSTYQDLQINLLKYALNQIKLEKRQQDFFMTIKHTFRESEQTNYKRTEKRNHSFPKNKQNQIIPQIQSNNFKRQNSEPVNYV